MIAIYIKISLVINIVIIVGVIVDKISPRKIKQKNNKVTSELRAYIGLVIMSFTPILRFMILYTIIMMIVLNDEQMIEFGKKRGVEYEYK